jgi:hypothetical protein
MAKREWQKQGNSVESVKNLKKMFTKHERNKKWEMAKKQGNVKRLKVQTYGQTIGQGQFWQIIVSFHCVQKCQCQCH